MSMDVDYFVVNYLVSFMWNKGKFDKLAIELLCVTMYKTNIENH